LQEILGRVARFDRHDNVFEFQCKNGKSRITVLGPKIVRVQASWKGDNRNHDSFARVPYGEPVQVKEEKSAKGVALVAEHFRVNISFNPFALQFLDSSGTILQDDSPDGGMVWEGHRFECRKRMLGDEHFYGTGEKAHGLDKRGLHYEMWNTDNGDYDSESDPLYQSIPFFTVLNNGIAFGVFLDNTYRTRFDFGHRDRNSYSFGAPDGPLDYYIIMGPRISEVIDGYTSLTGRPCFLPRWALGHQQSRFMIYESEEDILKIGRELRNRKIPCDTLVLDIGYMDEARVFTWKPNVFPDPKAFAGKLAQMGFRAMTIIDPGVKLEPGYFMYDEGVKDGHFLKKKDGSIYVGLVWPGETVFPDFSRPEVREWFGSKYEMLARSGTSNSSWIDMNEPSNCIYDGLKAEYSMTDVVDKEGNLWEPRLRNIYALGMAQAAFDGLRKSFPNTRPFILTRAGFAGYQRYAATWTGDNHSTWPMLWLSIPMLLNLGLSGIPFCGTDIGGFGGDTEPELLARWYQLGAFYPFSRNHSDIRSIRQEPWLFGEDVERVARDSISLRYRLLRYLYSLARIASTNGLPIMRPLVLEFQNDSATYALDTQFMIGPFMMLAPILEKGAESRDVYFPQGTWYDLWTDAHVEGPLSIRVDASFERMPTYLRGGSIIPVGNVVQTSDEDQGDLVLWIYPAGTSSIVVYEDDGISEKGPSAETRITQESTDDRVVIAVDKRTGKWRPAIRSLIIELRGLARQPGSASIDGTRSPQAKSSQEFAKLQSGSYYDSTQHCFQTKLVDDGSAHKIVIAL